MSCDEFEMMSSADGFSLLHRQRNFFRRIPKGCFFGLPHPACLSLVYHLTVIGTAAGATADLTLQRRCVGPVDETFMCFSQSVIYKQATGTVTTHAHGVEVAKSDMLDHVEEDRPW